MKLTGKLKDKVDAADTKEEKKAIIAEAGMELTDEELEGVAAGRGILSDDPRGKVVKMTYPKPE